MFPMTVTVSSRAELQAVMAALADTNEYAKARAIHAEPAASSPTMPEGNMTFTRIEPKKPVAVAPTLQASSVAAQPAADDSAEKTPTYEEVAAALRRLAASRGVPAAVRVLAQFDVAKAPELKPSQYAAVRAAIEEAWTAQKEAA